jgi:hypothetical protein
MGKSRGGIVSVEQDGKPGRREDKKSRQKSLFLSTLLAQ